MNDVLNSIQDAVATEKPVDGTAEKTALTKDDAVITGKGTDTGKRATGHINIPAIEEPVGEPDYTDQLANSSGLKDNQGLRSNFDYNSGTDMSKDPTLSTQGVINGAVTNEKSWDSRLSMDDQYKATDTSDYSWNQIAGKRSQYVYEQEASQVLSDYSKSMQEIKAAGAQAMDEYFGAMYSANQTADKMGWSGGQLDSQEVKTKFLQAQEAANMFNKFELQKYGLESQLSVARMYANAKMDELALELYQNEVDLAMKQADVTGYYMPPEASEMLKQITAAEKLANDPNATEAQKQRAEQIKGAAYEYFKQNEFAQDPETGKYLGIETLAKQEYEMTVYMNKITEQYQKDMLTEAEKQTEAAEDAARYAELTLTETINNNEFNNFYTALEKNGEFSYNGKTFPAMINSSGKYQGLSTGQIAKGSNGSFYLKDANGKVYIWSAGAKASRIPGKWASTSKIPSTLEWTDVQKTYGSKQETTKEGE